MHLKIIAYSLVHQCTISVSSTYREVIGREDNFASSQFTKACVKVSAVLHHTFRTHLERCSTVRIPRALPLRVLPASILLCRSHYQPLESFRDRAIARRVPSPIACPLYVSEYRVNKRSTYLLSSDCERTAFVVHNPCYSRLALLRSYGALQSARECLSNQRVSPSLRLSFFDVLVCLARRGS
jgi:hypothetical protein